MRFLDTTSLKLGSPIDRPPSAYAILSYAWDDPLDKLTPRDVDRLSSTIVTDNGNTPLDKHVALQYVAQACGYARTQNIGFLWVFGLCVDKSSSADVIESVTASFRLIWEASICIVHLSDLVSIDKDNQECSLAELEDSLSSCRWFTRGWTLQELIAARHVEFFDRDWNARGTKNSKSQVQWLDMLSRVSHVDASVLAERNRIFDISLGRRISWAAHRSNSRQEDAAYSLIGICGIQGHFIPCYGEGGRSAFLRLQKTILMTTSDLSILAWQRAPAIGQGDCITGRLPSSKKPRVSGVLAESAAEFLHFVSISGWDVPFASDSDLVLSNRGLCVHGLLSVNNYQLGTIRDVILVLNASWRSKIGSVVFGILVREVEPGLYVRSNPYSIVGFPLRGDNVARSRICIRLDIASAADQAPISSDEKYLPTEVDVASEKISESAAKQVEPKNNGVVVEIETDGTGKTRRLTSSGRSSAKRSCDSLSDHGCDISYCSDTSDDLLLFDSLPFKPEQLRNDHYLGSILPDLVALGLDAWEDDKAAKATEEASVMSNEPALSQHVETSQSSSPQSCKLIRKNGINKEQHQSGSNRPSEPMEEVCEKIPNTMITTTRNKPQKDILACPFYKLDPSRHHDCMWELELADTNAIKQHVIVDHRLHENCPICHDTFERTEDRNQHIISRRCNPCDPPENLLRGVTDDQIHKLSQQNDDETWKNRKKLKGMGRDEFSNADIATYEAMNEAMIEHEKKKWFDIWDFLFPKTPRPESPYLSAPGELQAVELRSFWHKAGPGLVASELKKRNLQEWENVRGGADVEALTASVFKGMRERLELVSAHGTG